MSPVTQAPVNPFFPTEGPSVNPTNPFLNPVTQAPVRPVTVAPTARPTQRPPTVAPAPAVQPTQSNLENRLGSCRGPDTRVGTCIQLIDCKVLTDELLAKQSDQAFANYLRLSNTVCGGTGTMVCCPDTGAQSNNAPTRLPTPEDGCGYTSNSYKKIVGGEVSKKGAWPWIALIGYDDELSASPFKCGGALVSARHVVTAAHCVRKDL